MSEWDHVRLADIAIPGRINFIDGDWIEAPYITNEGVRLIQTGNIGVGHFKDKNKKYISHGAFYELRCKDVFPGDILICRLAEPAGRACVVPQLKDTRFITSVDVTIFRVNENLFDKEFVQQSINTEEFLERCQEVAGGTTRTRISRSNLGSLTLFCPPLKQQQKIATILSTVDQLIEKTQTLIDKYTAIKQGMMADLFTRGIDLSPGPDGRPESNPNYGRLRPPREEAPELYKESELGWVPKEWEVYSFGELAGYKNGNSFSASEWMEEGLPIIRIQNLNGSEDFNYYQGPLKESWHVLPGDLLFAWSGQKGVSFGARIWTGKEGVLNQHIFKVIENERILSRAFLYYLFKLNIEKIEDSAHGFKDSFLHVTRSELTEVKVSVAPVIEQEKIVTRVSALEKSISGEERNLEKYQKLKKGLMQDLLTGKVEVN